MEKWGSPLEHWAVIAFPMQKLYPAQKVPTIPSSGRCSHPGGTRENFAGLGANFCALKKVVRRLLTARWLVEKGLFLHYCFHEGSSDFPVICSNLVIPRVSSCREGIPWLLHPKCCVCLSSVSSPWRIFCLTPD